MRLWSGSLSKCCEVGSKSFCCCSRRWWKSFRTLCTVEGEWTVEEKEGRVLFFFSLVFKGVLVCVCALAVGGGQVFYFIFRPAQLVPSSPSLFVSSRSVFFLFFSSSFPPLRSRLKQQTKWRHQLFSSFVIACLALLNLDASICCIFRCSGRRARRAVHPKIAPVLFGFRLSRPGRRFEGQGSEAGVPHWIGRLHHCRARRSYRACLSGDHPHGNIYHKINKWKKTYNKKEGGEKE